ncbi:arginine--tRNA ligase [Lachnoclostridium sp. Marseille-P6806]|uniref:arginine--tRNA ligase n=1 Tax=Lachnoclostridium sp. Marseille-P6806 TaxID=2364793 RepID=UPI001030EF20|nr:arginine--tRNA ligase [Lachnoclostridium sp. Marseille-P6806]
MQKLLDMISEEVGQAFAAAGYDAALGRTTISNRPDLCEFQCNGAMTGAKQYRKAPFLIAEEVAVRLMAAPESVLASAEAVKPGFLNFRMKEEALAAYLNSERVCAKFGLPEPEKKQRIVLDYGGPNVAKPLHVGHLRSAVIGEALKRMGRYNGHEIIGDIHMGDWGLQMGLVITELRHRSPELPYFDESFAGEYPEEAPFTVSDLEEIYPAASARSKEDEAYYGEAMEATHLLQEKKRGYYALWQKIIEVSVADLRKNYAALDVDFDLWNGESAVNDIIPGMVERIRSAGCAYESNGALVIDVAEESDAKELPPCILLKSDGAALYTTTDLATIQDRMTTIMPDELLYVTDKRQELHFTQVFRAARKTGLVPEHVKLTHIGFGTVNGKDGKPFKTRQGGVMRLETLIADINEEMLKKIRSNEDIPEEEARRTAEQVALAALKYGDLSNQSSKDYIFDMDKFCSFEGDTGPYILYTMVRIKSILHRAAAEAPAAAEGAAGAEPGGASCDGTASCGTGIREAQSPAEKSLQITLARFGEVMQSAWEEKAPHRICSYIYGLSNEFNSFYHGTKILSEADREKRDGWLALLGLALGVLEACISVLGFEAPERM